MTEGMVSLLPGGAAPFLYLAVVGAVLLMARRSRHGPGPLAAAGLALLPLVILGGALLGGDFHGPDDLGFLQPPLDAYAEDFGVEPGQHTRSDIRTALLPMYEGVRHAYAHGQWPLLNPFVLSGQILAPAMQAAPYHPVVLVSFLLPVPAGWTLKVALGFFLAGLGAFLFARATSLGELPALLAATGWTLCQYLVYFTGWTMGLAAGLLPLVLWATLRAVREPGRGSALLLAGTLVLLLLAGHPETVVHVVLVGVALAGVELVRARSLRVVGRAAGTAVLAGALALGACAAYLLPALSVLDETREYALRSEEDAAAGPAVDEVVDRARTLLVPFVRDSPPEAWNGDPWNAAFRPEVGSVLVPLALFGLLAGRWRWRAFFAILFAVGAAAFVQVPGVARALGLLPHVGLVNHKRLAFAAAFALVVLAAAGLEAWSERRDRRLAALYGGWLLLVGLGLWRWAPGLLDAGFSPAYLRGLVLIELAPVAALAAILAFRPPLRLAALCVLAAVVVQRGLQTKDLDGTLAAEAFYPEIPEIEAIPTSREPFRVVGLRNALAPGASPFYGLEDPRGFDALRHAGYLALARQAGAAGIELRLPSLDAPLLDLLNVRYAFVPHGGPRPDASWVPMARGRSADLYENREALPRAFVPDRVVVGLNRPRTMRAMRAAGDFRRVGWIAGVHGSPVSRGSNGPGVVTTRWEGTELRLQADMERPGWVIVSQAAWRGWRAWEGDREIPVRTADRALLGIELPEGRHEVRLRYWPRSFTTGLWLSLGSLIATAWMGWSVAGRRSRPSRPSRP